MGAPAASEEGIMYLQNAVIYDGLVVDMPVSVMVSSRPFDPSAHQVTKVEGSEDGWLLDGNLIRGADGLPRKGFPQLSGVVVRIGEKTVRIPGERLTHVISPQLRPRPGGTRTTVTVSANGKVVQVEIPAGRDSSLPILVDDAGKFQFIRAYIPGP